MVVLPQVEMEITEENNRETRQYSCENQTNLWAKKFPFQSQAVGSLAVEQTRQCPCQSVPDKQQGQEKALNKRRRKEVLGSPFRNKGSSSTCALLLTVSALFCSPNTNDRLHNCQDKRILSLASICLGATGFKGISGSGSGSMWEIGRISSLGRTDFHPDHFHVSFPGQFFFTHTLL